MAAAGGVVLEERPAPGEAPPEEAATPRVDALVLAGGRTEPDMARLTGTCVRALFPYQGKPFVQWVFEALRASTCVERIAIVGPEELAENPVLATADLLVPEADSIEANLFGALARLLPQGRVLVTASDKPLLEAHAVEDFVRRAPVHAAVAYPILRHQAFLHKFPRAANIAVTLRDGAYIGGDCVLLNSRSIPRLQRTIQQVLWARKDRSRLLSLLGWRFALRFKMRRVSSQELEERLSEIAGLSVRFVRDSSPVFAIDIDDAEDWRYLQWWSASGGGLTSGWHQPGLE